MYSALENSIISHLLEANESQSVELRFSTGMKFTSDYIPSHEHEHPATKEIVKVDDKLRFGFRYSKDFKLKRNQDFHDMRELWKSWEDMKKETLYE
nr:MAG TPA: hypothetical protein [Caudoviricetes sp.]